MDELRERDVARGLAAGNADAWRAVYDAYADRVWRGVARLVGPSAADVADVVQETFLAAAKSARGFDPTRGPLWAWLWGIARTHVALHYRRLNQQARLKEAVGNLTADGLLGRWVSGPCPVDAALAAELSLLVRAVLADLPAEYEAILTAKYLDGEPVEAIAGRDGATESAVRSKLARARHAFRDAFEKHSPSERPVGVKHDPAGR